MSSDRIRQEAELLAQAVAAQMGARTTGEADSGSDQSVPAASPRAGAVPSVGWGELVAGAALAARGGMDLVGSAVTRWVDGSLPARDVGAGGASGPASPPAAAGDTGRLGERPARVAFHRAPRRTIPVRDGGQPHSDGTTDAGRPSALTRPVEGGSRETAAGDGTD